MTCQLYFAFYNAFSVQSLYNSIFLTFYNITFTSAPILAYGLFEQKHKITKIEKNPYLYRSITKNKNLSALQFFKWMAFGIWHSLVAFFFTAGLSATTASFSQDGKMSGYVEFGSLVICIVVVVVHVKVNS